MLLEAYLKEINEIRERIIGQLMSAVIERRFDKVTLRSLYFSGDTEEHCQGHPVCLLVGMSMESEDQKNIWNLVYHDQKLVYHRVPLEKALVEDLLAALRLVATADAEDNFFGRNGTPGGE